jgi:hypothetical protein
MIMRSTMAVLAAIALFGCAGDSGAGDRAGSDAGHRRQAVEKAIWGPVRLPDGSSAFPRYQQLGVQVFQIQLRWSLAAPTRPRSPEDPEDPAYRWPKDLDVAIAEGAERGIETAVLVTTTPPWANGGREAIRAPTRSADYARFLTAAARRYPSVGLWMIWGEPNRADRFLPNRPNDPVSARRYARLLDGAYGALKEVSPDNIVIGGMTFAGGDVKPAPFLRWMRLPSGKPPRLDWYGHNPYPFRYPDLAEPPYPGGWRDLSDLDTLGAEVRRAYRPLGVEPRLWLSEFTAQSDHRSSVFRYAVSRAEQARWLRAGYRVAAQQGDVAALGWFTLLDEPEAPGHAHWGLMTSDAEPKPAYWAYVKTPGAP